MQVSPQGQPWDRCHPPMDGYMSESQLTGAASEHAQAWRQGKGGELVTRGRQDIWAAVCDQLRWDMDRAD